MYSEENIGKKGTKTIGPLHIIRNGHPHMLKAIEQCIKSGYQLMLEDMGETTDPSLEPVLLN